jgi:transcriptional regulator with PAS, ATPase and Fis domain
MELDPQIHAILNCFPEPAILLSRDYEILLANDAYRSHYGMPGEVVRQKRCYQVSHGYSVPCDQAGESCPLKESLGTGDITRVLHIHHSPRGEEYVNVEMWPVKDPESGEILYFIERMMPSDAGAATSSPSRLVGRAPVFRDMLSLVERVAPTQTTVMLLGETGTGKEVVAETIHRLSDRQGQRFVPVECTGLPGELFESELFGYVKGAFTGAVGNKTGLVESASGGTLFLDEVGEIPLPDQVKLLRLLETRRYRPVGSNDWRETDFRLVCASNKDLAAMVEAGAFREDLYYRLNVFEIRLPPLRERIEDLEPLIETILARMGRRTVRFSPEALGCLRQYAFPGNIRELRNIVERAVVLSENGIVDVAHLPAECTRDRQGAVASAEEIVPLELAERRYLERAVALHQGDRRALADKLGISERALYRKLAELKTT